MVLKVGKRGVRSGNTLKASTSRHLRQYRKQSCLTRQCIRNEEDSKREFADVLERDDINAENVPFSLNKKERWRIPDQLKKQILDGYFSGEDFGVQLIERHKIVRRNNGVSFCASKRHVKQDMSSESKETKKRNGYLDIENIMNTKPSTKRRNQKGRKAADEGADVYEPSQIRYEVVYPCSISSSITHNPKYIGYETKGSCDLRGEGRNSRGKRHRQRFKTTIEESLSCFGDDSYEGSEEDEDQANLTDEDEQRAPSRKGIILKDLLRYTARAQGLFRRESYIDKSPYDGTDRVNTDIIPGKERDCTDKENASHNPETINTVPDVDTDPALLVLSNNEIDPYDLEQIYGRGYIECECFPRKFIIEISDVVSNVKWHKSIRDHRADDTTACLVFTHDVENEINNAADSVYKVTLNTKVITCTTAVKIETLFDYTPMNISEIIDRTVFFIETLRPDILIKESECSLPSESELKESADTKCKSYLPTETYLYQALLSGAENKTQAETLGFEVVSVMDTYTQDEAADITSPKDRFCYICYEEIGGTVPATALMSCGHWFCDNCWREHLTTSVNSGATKLICPEYDCNRTVDPGTLLSLITIQQVLKHSKFCHDSKVEQQRNTKWCPSPNCGRVVEVSSANAKTAQCGCKKKFCFQCLGDDHWPAPCDVVPEYKMKLYDSGDESVLPADFVKPFLVHGKHCPHCRQFMEKDGGCNQMICTCGNYFCWGCGKKWDMYEHGNACANQKTGYNDKHGTVVKSLTVDEEAHTYRHQKWYSLAVSHRMQQHPRKVHKLKSAIPELTKTIVTYIRRSVIRGEPVAFDFSGRKFENDFEKVHAFLIDMVDLYTEVNHIAEHIGVLLSSDTMGIDTHVPLKAIVTRLGAFGKLIYEAFTSGTVHNPKLVLKTLTEIYRHVKQCVEGLEKCIEKIGL